MLIVEDLLLDTLYTFLLSCVFPSVGAEASRKLHRPVTVFKNQKNPDRVKKRERGYNFHAVSASSCL